MSACRLAALVSLCVLGLVACTRAQAEQGAKDVRNGLNAYCDKRAEALRALGAAGMGGAP